MLKLLNPEDYSRPSHTHDSHQYSHTDVSVYTTCACCAMQCAFCIRSSLDYYFIELARVRAAAANALSLFKLMLSCSVCYFQMICGPRLNTRQLIILLVFCEKCISSGFLLFAHHLILFLHCGEDSKQRKSCESFSWMAIG